MLSAVSERSFSDELTLDKAYDTKGFVEASRELNVCARYDIAEPNFDGGTRIHRQQYNGLLTHDN
jgi:hypothetical protein